MRIALKIFAFLSAIGVAYFDLYNIESVVYNPDAFVTAMGFHLIPIGILLGLFYGAGFLKKGVYKKIAGVFLCIFTALYFILRVVGVIYDLSSGIFSQSNPLENYRGILWLGQALVCGGMFLLGLSAFIKKLQKISTYITLAGIAVCIASFVYLMASFSLNFGLLFDVNSDAFFITPQILVLIGYVGIYLKEVWLDNELL